MCVRLWMNTDGFVEGWVVAGGGHFKKNKTSLYISKSVRLERNQVSVQSRPRTQTAASRFRGSQSFTFFFSSFSQTIENGPLVPSTLDSHPEPPTGLHCAHRCEVKKHTWGSISVTWERWAMGMEGSNSPLLYLLYFFVGGLDICEF